MIFKNAKTNVPWSWAAQFLYQISCSQGLRKHCSNAAKEADILDRCGLPVNGLNLLRFKRAGYTLDIMRQTAFLFLTQLWLKAMLRSLVARWWFRPQTQ